MHKVRRLALVVAAVMVLGVALPLRAAAAAGFHTAWVGEDPWPTLAAGQQVSYTFHYRNTGTEAWQRGVSGRQVNLGIAGDSHVFADAGMAVGWLAPDRPATTSEAVVVPGAIATFTFAIRAPSGQGRYVIPVHPVLEGVTHLEDEGAFLLLTADSGFHSKWVSESAWPTLDPGQTTAPVTIAFGNTGTKAWVKGDPSSQVNLGINGDDRSQSFLAAGWPSPDRVAAQTEASVAPGQTATFTFQMRAPAAAGTYQLHLRPVIDGVTWLEDEGVYMALAARGTGTPAVTATVVQRGLSSPWDLAFAPDGRMFVTEKPGNILVFASGAANAAQLANNPVSNVRADGEAGVMGIALDPAFATNGFVYLCASRTDGGWVNQVLRYRATGSTLAFDGYVIRTGMFAAGNHDGCRIRFGPDGKLWVTMGEAGNPSFSQNPNALNGKILRVNPDGSVPSDNPIMPGAAARTLVYTMGHRNPQGIAFQPGTGQAFAIEHAHYVDHATGVASHATVMRLEPGGNYSWPNGSGFGYKVPVWQSRDNPFVATSGGAFVSDAKWGSWTGNLFLGALSGQMLMRLAPNADGTFATAQLMFVNTYGRLRGPAEGPDGALYITGDDGIILRVSPQ
ncbi:MAG TPA: PQQ-dependent sugar dehydrogenase [Candidatus Limnocylindria bacterium]|nr:PQQ-dependent sugar dehydrogenase [Candidatus Limnocylindria bacterium]